MLVPLLYTILAQNANNDNDGGGGGDGISDVAKGLIGGMIVLVPVLGAEIIKLMKARGEASKEKAALEKQRRVDALAEWKDYCEKLEAKDEDKELQIRDLYNKLFIVQESEKKCIENFQEASIKIARQEGVINQLTSDVRRLQAQSGDTHPGVTVPVIIIAGTDGTIVDVTAASGSLFHWLPQELRGKNVELLIPDRLLEGHRKALGEVKEGKRIIDPAKIIRTIAKRRDGREIEISIVLSTWNSPRGSQFITAEIRQVFPSPEGEKTLVANTKGK